MKPINLKIDEKLFNGFFVFQYNILHRQRFPTIQHELFSYLITKKYLKTNFRRFYIFSLISVNITPIRFSTTIKDIAS